MDTKFFLLSFLFLFSFSLKSNSQMEYVISNDDNHFINPQADSGVDCAGGEIHDDGTFEGGVGWASVTTDGRFVIKFQPVSYPWQYNKFCLKLGRVSNVTSDMTFDIAVYDTTGSGGSPGSLVYELDSQHVTNIPVIPNYQFYSFSNLNIPVLNNGGYYIGIKYNPSQNNYMKYSAMDIDCPYWPGYYWSNFQPYWTPIEQGFLGLYRCLGYRMEGSSPVGIESDGKVPAEFLLSQNYPNPFNPSTTINYELPKETFVELTIYDVMGSEVIVLVNKRQRAGVYSVEWNASNCSSGLYYYRLAAGDYSVTKKAVSIK